MNILIFLIAVWDYSYSFTSDFTYDNNIFSYSAEYINDFMHQVRPYRFPFETYDDLISSAKLRLLLRNKFFGKRTTTFNFNAKFSNCLINNQKDYWNINFGIRQSFGKYAIKLLYQIIPKYLIRYYRNPQGTSTDYIGCEVKYQTLSGKLSFNVNPNLLFDLQYKRRWEDYISEFDVYDANAHIVGLGPEIKLKKRITFTIAYEFKTSKNDSIAALETGVEPVPESAYNHHAIESDLTFEFKLLSATKLGFGYKYTFRNFTATFSADSMHFGRQDHIHKITASTEFRIFTGMNIEISYIRQWRNATSEILLDIDRIKDYNKYRLSTGLSFYY